MQPSKPLLAVLTRPEGRHSSLAAELVKLGWKVLECPALQITPFELASGNDIPMPEAYDLVIFVSVPAIDAYRAQLGDNYSWPTKTFIGCVGQASVTAAREAFGTENQFLHPEIFSTQDSEALWSVIQTRREQDPHKLQRVLIVRGQDGRDWLAAKCAENGMHVDFHAAYCRKAATWSSQNLKSLQDWALREVQPVWLLTSTHGIEATVNQLLQAGLFEWALKGRFILTHPRQIAFLKDKIQSVLNVQTDPFIALEHNVRVSSPDQPSILLNFSYFRDNTN